MLNYLLTATMLAVLAFAPMSVAQTADGMTPAEEPVCDELSGALYGLCVAYCEAMDCHLGDQLASDKACERVLTNYMSHSEGDMPPQPWPRPPGSSALLVNERCHWLV